MKIARSALALLNCIRLVLIQKMQGTFPRPRFLYQKEVETWTPLFIETKPGGESRRSAPWLGRNYSLPATIWAVAYIFSHSKCLSIGKMRALLIGFAPCCFFFANFFPVLRLA